MTNPVEFSFSFPGSRISQPLVQFALGTHGWEDVSLVVSSDRPIASIDVSILFVKHSGQLWVDSVSVTEVRKGEQAPFRFDLFSTSNCCQSKLSCLA
jgi:hypothetical protein